MGNTLASVVAGMMMIAGAWLIHRGVVLHRRYVHKRDRAQIDYISGGYKIVPERTEVPEPPKPWWSQTWTRVMEATVPRSPYEYAEGMPYAGRHASRDEWTDRDRQGVNTPTSQYPVVRALDNSWRERADAP